MKNYEFIIAGLPYIEPDFDNISIDYDSQVSQIISSLDDKDRRYVDWLRFGLEGDNLSPHFYRVISKNKIKFLRLYFGFDLMLRNIQAAYISRKRNVDPSPYLVGENDIVEALKKNKAPDFGITSEIEFAGKLLQIFEMSDILDREKALDLLRWEEAEKICVFNYFDMNVILSYILRAFILKRWRSMDKSQGEMLFRKYVEEMKNSYKNNIE